MIITARQQCDVIVQVNHHIRFDHKNYQHRCNKKTFRRLTLSQSVKEVSAFFVNHMKS